MDQDLRQQAEYLSKWADGDRAPPFTLTLGITHNCNLKCRFCAQRPKKYIRDFKNPPELSENDLIRITEEAGELGVKKFNISGGGEPFLRLKTALKVMSLARKYGMNGGTSTNGTMLNREAAKSLVEMEWGVINFSIDGPDAKTHDYLRDSPGCFNKAKASISYLNYWKRELGIDMPELRFQTVLVNKNYQKVTKIIELAGEWNIKRVIFIPVTIHHDEGKVLKLSDKDYKDFQHYIGEAKELARSYGVNVNLDDFEDSSLILDSNDMDKVMMSNSESHLKEKNQVKSNNSRESPFRKIPCYEPWLTLVIHPTGFFDPCEMENNISKIGNRSLKEIWYEDEYLNKIRNCFLNKSLFKMCAKCCEPSVMKNKDLNDAFNKLYKGDR